jgi:hypothetical protein
MVEMIFNKVATVKHGKFSVCLFDSDGIKTGLVSVASSDETVNVNAHLTELDMIAIHTMLTDALDKIGVEHA